MAFLDHVVISPLCFRCLWQHVTEALRQKDIENATEHKRILEERQRTEERHRAETETAWRTRYFDREVSTSNTTESRLRHFKIVMEPM